MSSPPPPRRFAADFKRSVLRGLGVLLPSVLTLWLLVYAYGFVDGFIAEPINGWVRRGIWYAADHSQILRNEFDPSEAVIRSELERRPARGSVAPTAESVRLELRQGNIDAWWREHWWTNFIGFALAILAVYFAGRLVGGFVGRSIYARIERVIMSIPIIRAVYPSVKQMVDFLFSTDKPIKFSRVVAVEYPRKGIWSVGLVTCESIATIAPGVGDAVCVFMPSSPTPFTGYTITVPRSDIHELPISVDQALRFLVSGGVLAPELPMGSTTPPLAPSPATVPATGVLASVNAPRSIAPHPMESRNVPAASSSPGVPLDPSAE